MFIDMMLKRNEKLLRAATRLHQNGEIPANTYVIDVDAIVENVRYLSESAKENHLNLYYMTKQLGRHPFLGKLIEANGIEQAVCVDIDEAYQLRDGGCQIGHIGHIVQPSNSQWKNILTYLQPEVVTLFSIERAEQLSKACLKLGKVQNVILRVVGEKDTIYPGQHGGFSLSELVQSLDVIKQFSGIRVIGATSFPIFELNETHNDFLFTENMKTLLSAKETMEKSGIQVHHLNAPGATSCQTMPMLKKAGVTHGEPGHAITGTTPLHAHIEHLKEKPAIVYVSEISHFDASNAYTIAGGFYARSNMKNVLYGSTPSKIIQQRSLANQISPENIDYYGSIERNGNMAVGDTVLHAFRTQIFVTRAHVAYVIGINAEQQPKVVFFQKRGM